MSGPSEVTPRMGLICFAFGAAGVPPGDQLAGPLLIRLLADLGLSEAASRSLLLRMRREGLLDSEPAGRQARYRLTPLVQAAQARLERQLRGDRPEWTGTFNGVLFEVPERRRDFRDRLRRTAQLLGYATLRAGLARRHHRPVGRADLLAPATAGRQSAAADRYHPQCTGQLTGSRRVVGSRSPGPPLPRRPCRGPGTHRARHGQPSRSCGGTDGSCGNFATCLRGGRRRPGPSRRIAPSGLAGRPGRGHARPGAPRLRPAARRVPRPATGTLHTRSGGPELTSFSRERNVQ